MLVWNFLKGKHPVNMSGCEMGSCSGWKLFFPNEAVALVRFEACTRADVFLSGEGCLLLLS